MPAHDVEMSIPTTKVVLHADVVFEIRATTRSSASSA